MECNLVDFQYKGFNKPSNFSSLASFRIRTLSIQIETSRSWHFSAMAAIYRHPRHVRGNSSLFYTRNFGSNFLISTGIEVIRILVRGIQSTVNFLYPVIYTLVNS